MLSRTLALAVAGLLAAAPAATAAPKRVYVVSEARGFVHDSIPDAVAFFRALGRRSPRYDVIHLRSGAAGLTAKRLRSADAVVLANTSGELPLPSRAALTGFVRRGGALVGTHSASDTWHAWPGYERLLGGEFERHGPSQRGRLIVEGGRHPITRGLPRAFSLHEEFYEFGAPPRRRARILVRLDRRSVTDVQDADLPLVWARREGRGRVFYDALGHFPATWRHAHHSRIVARGLEWAIRLR